MADYDSNAKAGARRAMYASFIGTTLEWYEFFCFGTAAALVFGKLFFPSEDPLVGTLLSLSTFSVAFIVRPLGAIICGHLGDKFGRKNVLVMTLLAMGAATFLIGVLPTYQQVGILAPIFLIALRIIQGLSIGGEFSGAVLMSVEHAGPNRKGFFGALVNVGIPCGLILANMVFFFVSLLDDASFMNWGWRVPFLLSAVLVFVGLYIRLKVSESPEFAELKKQADLTKMPLKEVLQFHWGKVLLLAFAYVGGGTTFYLSSMFVLSYCEQFLQINRSVVLSTIMFAFVYLAFSILFFGWLSDKINRKKLLIFSLLASIPAVFIWFHLLGYRSPGMMLFAFAIFFIPHGLCLAVVPTFFAEVFPHKVRYTGMGIGYTLGTIIGSAASPVISMTLLRATQGYFAVAVYISITCVLSVIAASFLNPAEEAAHSGAADEKRQEEPAAAFLASENISA